MPLSARLLADRIALQLYHVLLAQAQIEGEDPVLAGAIADRVRQIAEGVIEEAQLEEEEVQARREQKLGPTGEEPEAGG